MQLLQANRIAWFICTLYIILYYAVCASEGYTLCFGLTSVYLYAHTLCRTSQYLMIFILLSLRLWNYLAGSVFDDVGLAGFNIGTIEYRVSKIVPEGH